MILGHSGHLYFFEGQQHACRAVARAGPVGVEKEGLRAHAKAAEKTRVALSGVGIT